MKTTKEMKGMELRWLKTDWNEIGE